jgi:hypothetical protein
MRSGDHEITSEELERMRREEREAVARAHEALDRTENMILVSRLAREETRCIVERTADDLEVSKRLPKS